MGPIRTSDSEKDSAFALKCASSWCFLVQTSVSFFPGFILIKVRS